jgi:hypothetical protein
MFSHASDTIDTQGHPFVGVQWPVTGSKGDVYTVEMTNYGFDCNCPAYRKCKHIKGVEERFSETLD